MISLCTVQTENVLEEKVSSSAKSQNRGSIISAYGIIQVKSSQMFLGSRYISIYIDIAICLV